jgi:hypothetical protein
MLKPAGVTKLIEHSSLRADVLGYLAIINMSYYMRGKE